jgi:coenzyme F420-reducing hydrogenase delta subunit
VNAKRRVTYLKSLLKEIGLEPERVQMYHVSSAQAAQFAQAARDMNSIITTIGPSPLRKFETDIKPAEPPAEMHGEPPAKGKGI